MNEDKFKSIDNLNKSLENINQLVLNCFSDIESWETNSITEMQKRIDGTCERVSENVNKTLKAKRNNLIKYLHDNYVASNEIISTFKPLIELKLTDLPSVINALKIIIEIYTKPYQTAIEFVTVLTPKLTKLTQNIAELANLKNNIPIPSTPGLNFDKLNIKMDPITIDEVISG